MEPDDPQFMLLVGGSFAALGDIERAREWYERALERDPNLPSAWFEIAHLPGFTADESVLEQVRLIPTTRELDDEERAIWNSTLARMYEQSGRYDEAWAHYQDGNRVARRARPYDRSLDEAFFERVTEVMTADFFEHRQGVGSKSATPIFVFGLPASGTTLVEQILASHPVVRGGGEMLLVTDVVREIVRMTDCRTLYVDALGSIDRVGWRHLAGFAARAFEREAGSAPRIIDKMPGNYRSLGLLAVLVPNAHFIHVHRDPVSVCLSNYLRLYPKGHGYANDLDDMAWMWSQYRALMDHWHEVAPIRIHDLGYEELVADQEGVTRDLLAACDLEWDDRCLEFHDTPRSVMTASRWDVRKPVYTSSIGRWRHFDAHLAELRTALSALGPARPSKRRRGSGRDLDLAPGVSPCDNRDRR